MKRHAEAQLLSWKQEPHAKPLIIRGARQVGKSYLVEQFGKSHFAQLLTFNFEKQPSLAEIFAADFNVVEILQKLEFISNARIIPGETLLFFDEIQRCPRAITALRYFKEEKPDLRVIAAGSLLDFALKEISVPVGRVGYLHLHPMSFLEFLEALGETLLLASLQRGNLPRQNDVVHARLLNLVRQYAIVGGMPEAVKTYLDTRSFIAVGTVHGDLVESFRQDFSKYARQARYPQLLKILEQIPKRVGTQIKYAHLDPDSRSNETKDALLLLERAQVVHRVRATSGSGLPLGAEASEKIFKAIFVDIGLMQNLCGIEWGRIADSEDFIKINEGALAEQFVGQELLAYSGSVPPALYYWRREAQNSSAEIDYVIAKDGKVCPVEVKSATGGRLKSLRLFCDAYAPPRTYVVSSRPYETADGMSWIPFYGIKSFL